MFLKRILFPSWMNPLPGEILFVSLSGDKQKWRNLGCGKEALWRTFPTNANTSVVEFYTQPQSGSSDMR
jgi:hypothetical protein